MREHKSFEVRVVERNLVAEMEEFRLDLGILFALSHYSIYKARYEAGLYMRIESNPRTPERLGRKKGGYIGAKVARNAFKRISQQI